MYSEFLKNQGAVRHRHRYECHEAIFIPTFLEPRSITHHEVPHRGTPGSARKQRIVVRRTLVCFLTAQP